MTTIWPEMCGNWILLLASSSINDFRVNRTEKETGGSSSERRRLRVMTMIKVWPTRTLIVVTAVVIGLYLPTGVRSLPGTTYYRVIKSLKAIGHRKWNVFVRRFCLVVAFLSFGQLTQQRVVALLSLTGQLEKKRLITQWLTLLIDLLCESVLLPLSFHSPRLMIENVNLSFMFLEHFQS